MTELLMLLYFLAGPALALAVAVVIVRSLLQDRRL